MTKELRHSRYPIIDYLRGVAVWLMIFFHISYDLRIFGRVEIDFQNDLFWWFLPRFIVFLFLLCAGMGAAIGHRYGLNWPNYRKRLLTIVAGATLISLATYLVYPKHWIYFGTLHCIALCSVASLPFLSRPILALLVSLGLLIPAMAGYTFWWPLMEHKSLDYIPFLPWFGVMTLGIFLAQFIDGTWHKALSLPKNIRFICQRLLQWPGQHSLSIYLIHQPIIYGILWLFFGQRN